MLFSIFLRVLFRVNRFALLPHNWLLNTLSFRFWFLFRRIFNRFTISWKRIDDIKYKDMPLWLSYCMIHV